LRKITKNMETIKIDKKALFDLIRLKEEFELIVESIELSSNPEVMASLKRSKNSRMSLG